MPKYIVRNPRGIPQGRHIIRVGERRWYEGDEFEPPRGIDVKRLLQGGFIERVTGGRGHDDG